MNKYVKILIKLTTLFPNTLTHQNLYYPSGYHVKRRKGMFQVTSPQKPHTYHTTKRAAYKKLSENLYWNEIYKEW